MVRGAGLGGQHADHHLAGVVVAEADVAAGVVPGGGVGLADLAGPVGSAEH